MSRWLFRQRDLTSVGSFAVGAETLEHVGDGVHACTMHVVQQVRDTLGRWLEEVSPEAPPAPLPAPPPGPSQEEIDRALAQEAAEKKVAEEKAAADKAAADKAAADKAAAGETAQKSAEAPGEQAPKTKK